VLDNNDLESRDFWDKTPFLLSLQLGDLDKCILLLDLGADKEAVGRNDKPAIAYAIENNHLSILKWLVEIDMDVESQFMSSPLAFACELGSTDCIEWLVKQNDDISGILKSAINRAKTLEIVQILVDNGADINDINNRMHAELLGLELDGILETTKQTYLTTKNRHFGTKNPEVMKVEFWYEMIKKGGSAWGARDHYSDTEDSNGDAVWSYQRFGKSTTILDNGYIIEIAGEHEDYYDPDFCIYNDVIVFDQQRNFTIYSYPRSVFPPTDFHTATLIEKNNLLIIGNLGYPEDRIEETQLYLLNLENFKIQKVSASGQSPGWIHGHKATLSEDKQTVMISKGKIDLGSDSSLQENIDDWSLNLTTWEWKRLTTRKWTRFEINRCHKKANHLWEIRQALWALETNWQDNYDKDITSLEKELHYKPDVKLIKTLYSFNLEHTALQEDFDESGVYWLFIDGIKVRFVEEMDGLQVSIEGELAENIINCLVQSLLTKLSVLENSTFEVRYF